MEIRTIGPFLRYFDGIRARTHRVVDLIPDAHMEWRHAEGRFSFGDMVRHLAAIERYTFAENVAGRASSYPGHGRELGMIDVATPPLYGLTSEEVRERSQVGA